MSSENAITVTNVAEERIINAPESTATRPAASQESAERKDTERPASGRGIGHGERGRGNADRGGRGAGARIMRGRSGYANSRSYETSNRRGDDFDRTAHKSRDPDRPVRRGEYVTDRPVRRGTRDTDRSMRVTDDRKDLRTESRYRNLTSAEFADRYVDALNVYARGLARFNPRNAEAYDIFIEGIADSMKTLSLMAYRFKSGSDINSEQFEDRITDMQSLVRETLKRCMQRSSDEPRRMRDIRDMRDTRNTDHVDRSRDTDRTRRVHTAGRADGRHSYH